MPFFRRLSIQSKLMSMLLLVAAVSIATVGWIAYSGGKQALAAAALNELTSVRASKQIQIEAFFKTMRQQVSNLSDDRMIVGATEELASGFRKLGDAPIKPEWDEKLTAFYRDDFAPKLAKAVGQAPELAYLLPRAPRGRYAQYYYIAANPNPPDKRYELMDAGDGSEFSAAHARYQPIFAKFMQDFHYDNLILADPRTGDVIYTFTKSPLFATNLIDGPYADTNAGVLFRSLRRSTAVGEIKVTDFAPMPSALGKPVALMGSAIFDGVDQVGVMLLQFPVDEINRVMTDDFGWVEDGLGKTGEVYLAGPDRLMRSRSRLLHEDPDQYFEQLAAAGYGPEIIERVHRAGTATLSQPVNTEAVDSALSGKTGTAILNDYRGVSVLTSFAPLDALGLRWVVISEMETSEAFGPLTDLALKIFVSSLIMVLIVAAAAAWLGRGFVRPILRLLDGARRLEAGERNVAVDIHSKDEFADLGAAFNHMSHNLTSASEALELRTRERDGVLDNLLPPAVAAPMKRGVKPPPQEYSELSIIYANILSLGDTGSSRAAENSAAWLGGLVVGLDAAAERRGVEKLPGDGTTYVACCGMSPPRADHASRILDFARDALELVGRLRAEGRGEITARIGVASGPAVGGVVGRPRFAYVLLGETMSTAAALASRAPPDTVLVESRAHAATRDSYSFDAPVQVKPRVGASLAAWPLAALAAPPKRGKTEEIVDA